MFLFNLENFYKISKRKKMIIQSVVDEIKNFHNTSQARSELESLQQSHCIFHKSDDLILYIKLI